MARHVTRNGSRPVGGCGIRIKTNVRMYEVRCCDSPKLPCDTNERYDKLRQISGRTHPKRIPAAITAARDGLSSGNEYRIQGR